MLAVAVLLAAASLACSLTGSGSDKISMRTTLPTLTRTPLPTLTPTVGASGVAAVVHTTTPSPTGLAPTAGAGQSVVAPTASLTSSPPAPAGVNNTGGQVAAVSDNGATSPANPATGATDQPAPVQQQPNNNPPTPALTATATPPPAPVNSGATPAVSLPAPAATPEPSNGWLFSSIRLAQERGELVLYGNVINKTGAIQELAAIRGSFFNTEGQPVANGQSTDDWPLEIVLKGEQVPFKVTAPGIQNAADFELEVDSTPSQKTLGRGFEFSKLRRSIERDNYCMSGQLRNTSGASHANSVVVLVLYDAQDNVINFSNSDASSLGPLASKTTTDFEVCAGTFGQDVARHDLQAWGL